MITLFHSGYDIIKRPDIHRGRKNADFGQGFYTTDNQDFAYTWAREKTGFETIINIYELNEEGLKIKELKRDSDWFEYIFANRRVRPDAFSEYDIIKGPIANDTIFDTFGIITSGFLSPQEAMKLLMIGPCFTQIVLKTEAAVNNLSFVSHEVLSKDVMDKAREQYAAENRKFQEQFAKTMQEM